jgi:hypothetical protein
MIYHSINVNGTHYRVADGNKDGRDYLVLEVAGHPIDVIELAPGAVGLSEGNGIELKVNAAGCVGGRAVTCPRIMSAVLTQKH